MTDRNHQHAFQAAAQRTTRAIKTTAQGVGIGLAIVATGLTITAAQQTLRLNGTMQFVTAPAASPSTASDLSFGPFAETATGQTKVILALKPAPNNQTAAYAKLSEMGSSHYAITRNAVVLDGQMVACRMEPQNCSPAVAQFRQLIETASTITDPTSKALLVNAWVNTAIAYDDDLVKSQKTSTPRRAPDLVETLETGKGICDQQAQLKLYALSRAGTPQQDLRYVGLMIVKDGKWVESHAVVLARLDGKISVLNDQQYDRDLAGKAPADDAQRLAYNSALQDPRSLLNLDYNAPWRQGGISLFPLYSANYVSAQPYQGMQDGENPPYYRGPAFARHLQPPRVTLTEVPPLTTQQQLAVSNILADALQFQDRLRSTLTLPTMTINAAEMKASAQRPDNASARANTAAPEF